VHVRFAQQWPWLCLVIGLGFGIATDASAQIQLEGEERAPVPEAPRAAPSAAPPPAELAVERPRPVDTAVLYPEGASGTHTVTLELLVTAEGQVAEVVLISGDAPFAETALAAARAWRFEPARRGGKPIATRLRFAVDFTPPVEIPAAEPTAPTLEPSPAPNASGSAAPAPPTAAKDDVAVDVLVLGERKETPNTLTQAEVRELPGAFGDAFRAIEILPGVVPIVSGLPYFYVRGAPPGNVGYFFDGVRVPVLYHFAAGPAILHPAFVGQVNLYPGAYPARYGRYAGAVVTGEMQDPEYRLRGEASIRLIDSGGMLEAPFAQGQGSVMAGGRFSYTGLLLSLLVPDVTVTYWDYQTRTRYALDEDDSIEVLLFGSGDYVSQVETDVETGARETITVVDMGFHRLDTRWDRQLRDGRWRNALMLGLDKTWLGNGEVELTSVLLGARSELDRQLDPKRRLRAGADILFESIGQAFEESNEVEPVSASAGSAPDAPPMAMAPAPMGVAGEVPAPVDGEPMMPGMLVAEEEFEDGPEPGDADFDLGFGDRIDFVGGAYADMVLQVAPRLEFTPGLRFDVFASRNDIAIGIDPRLRARYEITEALALVHALGLAHQMPSFPIPIPGITPSLKGGLQRSVQHSAGAEFPVGAGFTATTTLFHNVFFNMTDLIGVPDAEENGFRSTGHAYGFEAMIKRTLATRLGGFASYTLSRSERSLGRYHGPSTTDRTHVANVALSYDLGRNWRFGNRFMFYTGTPATRGSQNPDPSRRVPPFWRLDWRLQKRWLYSEGRYVGLVFEVLNTTLNKEVVAEECDPFGCTETEIGPVTVPSIGVEAAL
jgi:TonB family protein